MYQASASSELVSSRGGEDGGSAILGERTECIQVGSEAIVIARPKMACDDTPKGGEERGREKKQREVKRKRGGIRVKMI